MSVRRIDLPRPGYFRTRLVKRGPWVPARIASRASQPDRSPVLICMVAGEEKRVAEWWPRLHEIDEAEYRTLVAQMPDEVARPVDFLTDPVPFLGFGHNSRDAALVDAAERALSFGELTPAGAADIVTLVKQIIAWRDHEAEALAIASEPLKKALTELKRQHFCDAETYRPRLLAWLAEWAKAHGHTPRANGCTAHWTTVTRLVCDAEYETPRSYLEPDRKKIDAALKAGTDVPGWRLETKEEMRVV